MPLRIVFLQWYHLIMAYPHHQVVYLLYNCYLLTMLPVACMNTTTATATATAV